MLNANKLQLSIYYTMAIKRESFFPTYWCSSGMTSQTLMSFPETLSNLGQKLQMLQSCTDEHFIMYPLQSMSLFCSNTNIGSST